MVDIFAKFMQILIAILFGITISCVLGIHNKRGLEWLIAAICVLMYIIIRCSIPLRLFTNGIPDKASSIKSKTLAESDIDNKDSKLVRSGYELDPIKVPQVDVVQHGLPEDKFARYGTTKYPVMGPLDNLTEEEASKRLQYLAGTVSSPYNPMSYYNWRTDADDRRDRDSSALVDASKLDNYKLELDRWYPDTTRELTNVRDCTAYEPGHPFSCIQEWPEGNRPEAQKIGPILDKATRRQLDKFTDLEEDPLNKVVSDEYKRVGNQLMWRNAPGRVERNNSEYHSWHDMCRTCKVGKCLNGICGSRLVEPGNDNIIDAARLLARSS